MFFKNSKSTISINGQNFQGNNVSISNNKVYIDGKLQDTEKYKEINIVINGNIKKLSVDSCDKVEVTGDVTSLKTMSGDVEVKGNVLGDIKTMSGDIDCNNVEGNISTMSGDIKHRTR